jgi:hypothetical protein
LVFPIVGIDLVAEAASWKLVVVWMCAGRVAAVTGETTDGMASFSDTEVETVAGVLLERAARGGCAALLCCAFPLSSERLLLLGTAQFVLDSCLLLVRPRTATSGIPRSSGFSEQL